MALGVQTNLVEVQCVQERFLPLRLLPQLFSECRLQRLGRLCPSALSEEPA
jgi:hypothetical protein